MKIKFLAIFLIFLSFISCSNNEKEKIDSKSNPADSLSTLQKEKSKYLQSLKDSVSKLQARSDSLENAYKKELNRTALSKIMKISKLDHVVITVRDLNSAIEKFEKIGFIVKKGKKHSKGIQNAFIEFSDGTELELLTVENPKDYLAGWYDGFLEKGEGGAFLAMKNPLIDSLAYYYKAVNYNVEKKTFYNTYTTLTFPLDNPLYNLFFIKYLNENNNRVISHKNNAAGIRDIYWGTQNIKKTGLELFDAGFEISSRVKIPFLNKDAVEIPLRNKAIYLVKESDRNSILGVSISVKDISQTKNFIEGETNLHLKIYNSERGKSIVLPKEKYNNFYLEFIETVK